MRLSRAGVIDRARESEAAERVVEQLSIKAPDLDDAVGTLSGGNQQKVVIAKWLLNEPRIILLNDPTRGIDVGTKQEIYPLLRQLAAAGAAVLLYSTDYAELIGCCDRVAVFFDGRIVRWLQGDAAHRTRAGGQRVEHRGRPHERLACGSTCARTAAPMARWSCSSSSSRCTSPSTRWAGPCRC